jgi:hypothetical protein
VTRARGAPISEQRLDEETKSLLISTWLPHLHELKNDRKPLMLLMVGIILIPICLSNLIIVHGVMTSSLDTLRVAITAALLGCATTVVVFLGRLQSCNDVILVVECSLLTGNRTLFLDSINNIQCLGKLSELMRLLPAVLRAEVR